jgi:hypothetical protein
LLALPAQSAWLLAPLALLDQWTRLSALLAKWPWLLALPAPQAWPVTSPAQHMGQTAQVLQVWAA